LGAKRQSRCANPGQSYQASRPARRPARFAGRTPKSSQVLRALAPSSPHPHPKFSKPSPQVLQNLTPSSPKPHPKPVEELPGCPRRFAASGRNLVPHGQTQCRAACKQLCGTGVCHCACVAWTRLCRCGAVCDAGLQRWMVAQDSRRARLGFDCGAPENNAKNGVANPFLLKQEFASRSCIRLDGVEDEWKLPVENEAQASLAQLAEHALRKRTVVGSIPTGGYALPTLRSTHAGCSYARDSARCM
jgi:hypothetical protein